MKVFVFLFLLTLSQAYAVQTYSQQARINLNLKNAKIKDVFTEIENQSEFFFLYSPAIINEDQRIDVEAKNASIKKVLDKILSKSKFDYLILDRQIVISDKSLLNKSSNQKKQKTITGTVTDKQGNPLIGVNVHIKGTTRGIITNFNGKHSIEAISSDTLTFSFIGFKNQYIAVGNQTEINIVLKEDIEQLDEIIVVGYGVQRKINVTGSVTAVNGEELVKKTVPDVRQALQGESTGLTIIDRGGVPGEEEIAIKLRGISSFSAGTNPLVLVDGIEMPMSEVHPNDIQSISVLKDAASCAIYGSSAANGVILITTKRGSSGKFRVNYDGYYGIQTPATLPELLEPYDYLTLVNEALVNAGLDPKYSDDYIQNTVNGTDPYNYPYMNLFEELYQPAPMQNHAISINGGSDLIKLALSANHLKQNGLLTNVLSERTGIRLNTDFAISEKLSISTDASYSIRKNERPNRLWSATGAMIGSSPVNVLKYPNGAYGLNKDNTNALACLEVGGMNEGSKTNLNIKTGINYEIFDGLNLKGDISYKDYTSDFKNFKAEYTFVDPRNTDKKLNEWSPSSLYQGGWTSKEITSRIMGDFSKTIGDHNLHILGGSEVTDNHSSFLQGSRINIYSSDYPELNMGDVEGQENKGYQESWGLISFFGRVNYIFKDKYLLESNFRYDGSSRFDTGYKWGLFPSISAGWIVSKESFMESLTFISNLKLRASWGQLGNQNNLGLFKYTSTVLSDYPYNFNNNEVTGYSQRTYANTDITWETSEMLDFGFDLALLNNKIEVTADWYKKKTKDILLVLPISPMVGLNASETNAGIVTNTGWELGIAHKNRINELFYKVGFNISDVKNELTDFAGNEPSISGWTILKEGEAIYSLFGYESDGLFQSQEEIDNHASQPNQQDLKPGDIKLVDQNGDGEINDEDRVIIGSDIPRYTIGANLNIEYKGFDLNAVLQGVLKAENYFYGEANEGVNFEVFATPRALDRWTPDNPNATYPRLEAATNKNNYLYNDFWIRDASYVRLKNLQLGYTLPEYLSEKANIQKARMYVGVTNLFTITNVEAGIDPETYDGRLNYYPPIRTFSFGVQLSF